VGDPVVAYSYLGLNNFVKVDYPEPKVRYDLATGSGASPYAGLDRFGRIIDCRWYKYSEGSAPVYIDRFKHGYNRVSSRTWRDNVVSKSQTTPVWLDELYKNDSVQRLVNMARGDLTDANTAVGTV